MTTSARAGAHAHKLYNNMHIGINSEVNATTVSTNESQQLCQRLFGPPVCKAIGETSTVVFRGLSFNPKVVCVLAYLLPVLPPSSRFFYGHCVFFLTQRTNSAGIPRIHVQQENQMKRMVRSAENAQK